MQQHNVNHHFVMEVERIRNQRRHDSHERPHPDGKHFTQEELCDMVYPSYKNLAQGRTKRLPNRDSILAIAAYLECSSEERNQLLEAAQYTLEKLDVHDEDYAAALRYGQSILNLFPFAACLITHGWQIHTANTLYKQLIQVDDLDKLLPDHRNMTYLSFAPTSAAYRALSFDPTYWRMNAFAIARMRKSYDFYHRHEDWYRKQLAIYKTLPDFEYFWNQAQPQPGLTTMTLIIRPDTVELLHMNIAVMSLGPLGYPAIVTNLPLNEAARQAYARLRNTIGTT